MPGRLRVTFPAKTAPMGLGMIPIGQVFTTQFENIPFPGNEQGCPTKRRRNIVTPNDSSAGNVDSLQSRSERQDGIDVYILVAGPGAGLGLANVGHAREHVQGSFAEFTPTDHGYSGYSARQVRSIDFLLEADVLVTVGEVAQMAELIVA